MPNEPLYTDTSERGFDHHLAVLSEYGGGVTVSESSNASYPGVWLRATAPVDLNNPTGATVEAPMNLTADNAWLVARQLAATVAGHYWGDMRPDEAIIGARAAVAAATDWSDTHVDALLGQLAAAGYVLINVAPGAGAKPVDGQAGASPRTVVTPLLQEPPDLSLVGFLDDAGNPYKILVRDDKAAVEGDYAPDEHWFPFADDTDEDPETWRSLSACEGPLVQLHTSVPLLAGVSVRREWGVHSDDGEIYNVKGGQDEAIHNAVLLRDGVPGDPERTPEPGATPASRYVLETPQGTVATGWRWPSRWVPPPLVEQQP